MVATYKCLAAITFVFVLLGFVGNLVALLTNYWRDREGSGLIWTCSTRECNIRSSIL